MHSTKACKHVYIKPRTPRLNGKVERSHRIDAEEFYRLLDGDVIDDAKVFNDKLRERRTTTSTTDPTAASTTKPRMKDSARKQPTQVSPINVSRTCQICPVTLAGSDSSRHGQCRALTRKGQPPATTPGSMPQSLEDTSGRNRSVVNAHCRALADAGKPHSPRFASRGGQTGIAVDALA